MIITLFKEKNLYDVAQHYILPHFHQLSLSMCIYHYSDIEIITTHPDYNNCKYEVMKCSSCWGCLELLRHLVEKEHLVPDNFIFTLACINGHLPLVQYLCRHVPFDELYCNDDENTVSLIAMVVEVGELSILEYLVEQGVHDFNDVFRVQPHEHNIDAFKYLVGCGMNKDRLLGYVCWYKCWELALYLVDEGANIYTIFVDKTPIEWAMVAGRGDIFSLLSNSD